MITPAYVQAMAAYNRWQNRNLYGAADRLSDEERKAPRGAFFGSIHGTLNHLLWGDQIWMSRFAGTPAPKAASIVLSVGQHEDWAELGRERAAFDETIMGWADRLDAGWLRGDLTWFSGAAGREITKPRALLVAHMFNHQTHHRGQVHCMLTQCGLKPGDTDMPLMPR
ncbi:MAG: damage-inducible protein DinB [Hyphomicrobiaceae bacterium]|nr:MAG: damage-inducible protein DinB [Hyphomicrobiaceae bacterium]